MHTHSAPLGIQYQNPCGARFQDRNMYGQDGRSKVKTAESYICRDVINHAHVNKRIHMVLEGARRGGGAVSQISFGFFGSSDSQPFGWLTWGIGLL